MERKRSRTLSELNEIGNNIYVYDTNTEKSGDYVYIYMLYLVI
jgi:hypothetical protein